MRNRKPRRRWSVCVNVQALVLVRWAVRLHDRDHVDNLQCAGLVTTDWKKVSPICRGRVGLGQLDINQGSIQPPDGDSQTTKRVRIMQAVMTNKMVVLWV